MGDRAGTDDGRCRMTQDNQQGAKGLGTKVGEHGPGKVGGESVATFGVLRRVSSNTKLWGLWVPAQDWRPQNVSIELLPDGEARLIFYTQTMRIEAGYLYNTGTVQALFWNRVRDRLQVCDYAKIEAKPHYDGTFLIVPEHIGDAFEKAAVRAGSAF